MPIDLIRVNPEITPDAGRYGSKLIQLRDQFIDAIALLNELKSMMDHSNTGSNFAVIESTFGLPANSGQTVYDMLNGMSQALNGTGQNSQAIAFTTRVA